jgi:two-component system, LytTR family, sensor kinase
MKKLSFIFLFLPLASMVYAQSANSNRMIIFDGFRKLKVYGLSSAWVSVTDNQIDGVFTAMKEPVYAHSYKPNPNDLYGSDKWMPKTPLILGTIYTQKDNKKPSTYTIPSLSKSYTGYLLNDADSVVEVVAMGINRGNVNNYKFRVISNDSTELVGWTTPKLQQLHGAKHPYGYFGKFYSPGKELTIEVVNINNYHVRDGITLNWRNHLKPVINNVIGFKKGKGINPVKLKSAPKSKAAPLVLSADSLHAVNLFFKAHQTMPYDIYWVMGQKGDTILIQGNVRDDFFSLSNQYFTGPGSYKLLIYPVGTKDKNREAGLAFNVSRNLNNGFTLFQLLPYFLIVVAAFVIFFLYNKRRLRNLSRQKEIANLKLGSIRAQLNPHFMFNALTSIQNLINQQDITRANHYLSKFADLTRRVLYATAHELISLDDELKIINDYLHIEQLRFDFVYEVNVDETINIANTEVPGMLMQPFIENAAKHGVSGMHSKGRIAIYIKKAQSDMVITINDNGTGFNQHNNPTNGFGIALGRDRIALLNQIYKTQIINLNITSSPEGTTVKITLTSWFA